MAKTFDELWREIQNRHVITVQDRLELEYVFKLIHGCESYLEVGTAEGNSLYVLSHTLAPGAKIVSVDYGEAHTKEAREWVFNQVPVTAIHGNSHDHKVIEQARGKYDVVFIDAGHSFPDVVADAIAYGGMASRYIIFHDVQIHDVMQAFEWYVAQNKFDGYCFVNSTSFGYGIVKL